MTCVYYISHKDGCILPRLDEVEAVQISILTILLRGEQKYSNLLRPACDGLVAPVGGGLAGWSALLCSQHVHRTVCSIAYMRGSQSISSLSKSACDRQSPTLQRRVYPLSRFTHLLSLAACLSVSPSASTGSGGSSERERCGVASNKVNFKVSAAHLRFRFRFRFWFWFRGSRVWRRHYWCMCCSLRGTSGPDERQATLARTLGLGNSRPFPRSRLAGLQHNSNIHSTTRGAYTRSSIMYNTAYVFCRERRKSVGN